MPIIIDDMYDFLIIEKGENIIYNGIPARALLIDASSQINYEDDKEIIADFQLNTGDLIQYQGYNWFVWGQVNKHQEFKTYRSRIRKVEQSFKIVIDNQLQVIPAIFLPETQSVATSSIINVWTGNLKVILQDTALSKKIDINSGFIKMGAKWKVDGYTTEHLGLRTLYCEKASIGINDDMENEIADKNLLAVYSITISDANRTVNVGTDYTYTAIVTKNGEQYTGATIIWESSNINIANVTDGLIHGLDIGTVIISVYLESMPNVRFDMNIEIVEQIPDVITYRMYKANLDGTGKDYIDFELLQGETCMFGMERYINGILGTNDTYTFTLNSNGIPSTNFVYTVLNSTTVKIQNKKMSTPNLTLNAISNESSQEISQNILLKGAW